MPGLAIESSAKGWSDSTITARFIETLSVLDAVPLTILSVSECAIGTAVRVSEMPSIPAATVVLILM